MHIQFGSCWKWGLKYQFCGTVNQLTATEVSKETTTNYKITEKKQEIDNNNDCIVYCI